MKETDKWRKKVEKWAEQIKDDIKQQNKYKAEKRRLQEQDRKKAFERLRRVELMKKDRIMAKYTQSAKNIPWLDYNKISSENSKPITYSQTTDGEGHQTWAILLDSQSPEFKQYESQNEEEISTCSQKQFWIRYE